MVKMLSMQRPLIANCNASINSKCKHPQGHWSNPCPRVEEFWVDPPEQETLTNPHPQANFFLSQYSNSDFSLI